MKRKNAIATVLRLIGAVIFGMCLYEDKGTFIWFVVGCILTSIIIPYVITTIIFGERYDGTFLIDETDPTDVKFKLIFETEPELLAKSKDFMIRVDHREANMDSDGGVSNETEENKR